MVQKAIRLSSFCLYWNSLFLLVSSWGYSATNPIFAYTHQLPSPFTLRAGHLIYGTEVALGVTDFMQIGTNIFRDAFQFYNANAKLSLIDWESFACAFTISGETFNYKNIDSSNPDLRVLTYAPGGVLAFQLVGPFALMVGGNYLISNRTLVTDGITTSGTIRGATGEADLSWAYNNSGGSGISDEADSDAANSRKRPRQRAKSVRSVGNAFALGASYDFTYDLFGVGISHHWPGFQLGFHYYPAATRYPVYPIIAGGGSFSF